MEIKTGDTVRLLKDVTNTVPENRFDPAPLVYTQKKGSRGTVTSFEPMSGYELIHVELFDGEYQSVKGVYVRADAIEKI